ncbi:MAG TPA: hypothetical protein VKA91_06920 [Nitrososphaeraceae archaeon]|nr:hypothetical protein [Nitrososphaeraceae archaeon]
MAVIEGRDRAKYIKQGPSTRRILEENLLNNYSVKPYVTYLQLKYKMKKKNLFKKPVPIIPENI